MTGPATAVATETRAGDSPPAMREGSEAHCQTESVPEGTGWSRSRWNACRYQLRRNDIMVCRGAKCPYKFCGADDGGLFPVGSPCTWESTYARMLFADFDNKYPKNGIGRHLGDREELRNEFVLGLLLANRASQRMSLAMQDIVHACYNPVNGIIDRRPFHHAALADRYLAAAHNRTRKIDEALPAAISLSQEARMRTLMISHGYWRPLEGMPTPKPEDVPQWIRDEVEQRAKGTR